KGPWPVPRPTALELNSDVLPHLDHDLFRTETHPLLPIEREVIDHLLQLASAQYLLTDSRQLVLNLCIHGGRNKTLRDLLRINKHNGFSAIGRGKTANHYDRHHRENGPYS